MFIDGARIDGAQCGLWFAQMACRDEALMIKAMYIVAGLFVVGFGAVMAHHVTTARDEATQARLETEQAEREVRAAREEYAQLEDEYNAAVKRTAVTELLVEDGKLSVLVRTVQGVEKCIPTPFDPSREIYVDFVVLDGRLWVRRIFDDRTPPQDALVIEPMIKDIDWTQHASEVGKAVYRSLDEGRWVITVTGSGSLGLARVEQDEVIELRTTPAVKQFDEAQRGARVGGGKAAGPRF